MKSLFDNHWNNFQEVKYKEGLYCANRYQRLDLVFPTGLEGAIFEQNPYQERPSYPFLMTGYEGLTAITDIDAIRKRQTVIRAFMDDLNGSQQFREIFNNLNLLDRWTRHRKGKRRKDRSLTEYADSLKRYKEEVDVLVQEMAKYDNILGELSDHYRNRFPVKIMNNTVKACNQGSFDYVIMEMEPRDLKKWGGKRKESKRGKIRLHGVMGLPDANIQGQVMGGDECADNFGIGMQYLVDVAARKCLGWLNKVYAPLAALYSEAFYLKNNDVCLPQINEEGIFEMVDGKPIMPTPNPRGTSLYYDNKSGKVVLNGIHSGGKSHLLMTIGSYYLAGLSGFPVPAQSAKVPIVNRIFHSFDIEKRNRGGSLESEFFDRARTIELIRKGDLVLMDEFLQHASPDASTDLEPIILSEFYKTGSTIIVVTHRGDSLDDKDQWQFYSPGFTEENGRIIPTYKFQKGRPNQEILRRHAKQMLEDALKHEPVEKEKPDYSGYPIDMDNYNASERWFDAIGERLFGKKSLSQQFDDSNLRSNVREDDDIPF